MEIGSSRMRYVNRKQNKRTMSVERVGRKRKTDEEKQEKKRDSRKKYEHSQHIVRMNKDVFDRWQAAKAKECLKTNNEMAKYLLDCW